MSKLLPVNPEIELFDRPPILKNSVESREATAEQDVGHKQAATRPLHCSYLQSPHKPLPSTDLQTWDPHSNDSVSLSAGLHPNRHGPERHLESEHNETEAVTEFVIGATEKHFIVSTNLLLENSQHFAELASSQHPLNGPFSYPNLDEYAFALFLQWLWGYRLHGPSNFNSTNHYLRLYVLAGSLQIEHLKNTVMDLIRDYYREEKMTSSPYHLECIYTLTDSPCPMRTFLVGTAAHRALMETKQQSGLSLSMRGLLQKGGDLAVDYIDALLIEAKNG